MKPDVAALVRELRATLDQIGDALVNGSFDDLIATESRLAGMAGTFSQAMSAGVLSPAVPGSNPMRFAGNCGEPAPAGCEVESRLRA